MEKLKEKIIAKYGTVSKFCRLADVDRKTMQNYFDRKSKVKSLRWQAFELHVISVMKITKPSDEGKLITKDDRKKLQDSIIKDYNGKVQLFADVHEFDYTNVHQVLSGFRKRRTGIVRTILKAAE